ncbi:MAG: Fur family transcriptional regulator [Robiginitomaculum sp.]
MDTKKLLRQKNIRPTKIRKAIVGLLFDGADKHVTAYDVIDMARQSHIKTSIASVYNTLNQFAAAGLLRKVTVKQGKVFFDTNLSEHHHLYFENENQLEDIPVGTIQITGLPELPQGQRIKAIDVTVRI